MRTFIVLMLPLLALGCAPPAEEQESDSTPAKQPPPVETASESGSSDAVATDRFSGDGFSVDTPDGYRWKVVTKFANAEQSGAVYECVNADESMSMVLTVEDRERGTDGERSGSIKGTFNGSMAALKEKGLKFNGSQRPSLTSPIPDRLSFVARFERPDGATVYFHNQTVFGKKTYNFQVTAVTTEEALALLKVSDALKEG